MGFSPFSLGTNLCLGYDLAQALELVKQSGFRYAEISSIINMCEHVTPQEMNVDYAAQVRELLESKGMACHAFSGHVDLTEETQYQAFLKKIEFAARIGAKIINTNSGPLDRLDVFYRNMKGIIAAAEKWGIVIGLESHGDIIGTAKDSVRVFEYFNHPLVRLNYDTGNVLFYSGGAVKVEEDIRYGLPYLAHLHLKDIRIRDNAVAYCPIGAGDVPFPAFFRALEELDGDLPCGLEIPVHVRGTLDAIRPVGTPMPEPDILAAARESVAYVETLLQAE